LFFALAVSHVIGEGVVIHLKGGTNITTSKSSDLSETYVLGGEGLLDDVYRQASFNGVPIHPGTIRRRYSSL
jgi:hypothetical protein